jgi:molybdate transport system substrate-binding protein
MGDPGGRNALTVFAAASLTEPFTEIAGAFESQHSDVDVTLNFAGSQQLAQQIVQGASADVFASANRTQMDVVVQEGRIAAAEVHDFAHNRLVVITPADDPGHVEDLRGLARPDLKVVMAAPEVPAGAYALAFLDLAAASADLGPEYRLGVLSNVVSQEENVRAVLSKVALAEADAGVVYASDAAGEPRVRTLEIPQSMNPEIAYPIAVLLDAPEAGLARAFVEFARSTSGAAILLRHGFSPAGE